MRKITFLCLLISTTQSMAQLTFVPDDNFEQYLIDEGYDVVLDDYVATASINTVTALMMAEESIADLTGIAAFEALELLDVSTNTLTELDLSSNPLLKTLNCTNNDLGSLDLSINTALEAVQASQCNLTSINLSGCNVLKELIIAFNDLATIDLSSCTDLRDFRCYENPMEALDFSTNTLLERIEFSDCNLTSISLSGLTALREIYGTNNELTSIDFTDNNLLETIALGKNDLTEIDLIGLDYLYWVFLPENQLTELNLATASILSALDCSNNPLTSLDVSNNDELNSLMCVNLPDGVLEFIDLSDKPNLNSLYANENGTLKQINLKTGNPEIMTDLNVIDCPMLTCVQVDDVAYAEENWVITIDYISVMNENCYGFTDFDESEKFTVSVYPNPTSEFVNIQLDQTGVAFTLVDITGKTIERTLLTELNTQVDVSALAKGIYFIRLNGDGVSITEKIEVL